MGMDLPLAAIRAQIASAVDLIIHLGRLRDRSRKVLAISEVAGIKDGAIVLNPLFKFCEMGEADGKIQGELQACGTLIHTEKLAEAGIRPDQSVQDF